MLPDPTPFPQAGSFALWGDDHLVKIVQHLRNGDVIVTGEKPVNRRVVARDELREADGKRIERAREAGDLVFGMAA